MRDRSASNSPSKVSNTPKAKVQPNSLMRVRIWPCNIRPTTFRSRSKGNLNKSNSNHGLDRGYLITFVWVTFLATHWHSRKTLLDKLHSFLRRNCLLSVHVAYLDSSRVHSSSRLRSCPLLGRRAVYPIDSIPQCLLRMRMCHISHDWIVTPTCQWLSLKIVRGILTWGPHSEIT